ncbi:MAG: DHH family phosphoesterase [Candidatus Micrarchaeota archaeon]
MQTRLAGSPPADELQTAVAEPPVAGAPFETACRRVGNEVCGWNDILLCHHYDADGLSAAGLVASVFKRLKKKFSTLSLKRVDGENLEKAWKALEAGGLSSVVFVDLGSGQLELIEEKIAGRWPTAVIDHHVPSAAAVRVLQANCELHGYSGSTDACSASTAFYCFKDVEWRDEVTGQQRDNWDLCHLAVVGSVGDMQDAGGLVSLNRKIVDEACDRGLVEKGRDLRMFGRVSRNLVNFLAFASEPYLPGLTGREKNCAAFLEDNGIAFKRGEEWLHYVDLDGNERRKLVTALVNHCLEKGIDAEVVASLVGEVYRFPREAAKTELSDAYEFSTLLNACGRHGAEALGIAVCTREEGSLDQAHSVLRHHRMLISKGISFCARHSNDFGAFYFVDARGEVEDTVIGTVIGSFFASGNFSRSKPIIGFSTDPSGGVKISGRASKPLVEQGCDLNLLMREAAQSSGGLGGGHKIAAGASIPDGREEEFLRKAKEILEKQLGKRTGAQA